MTTLIQFRRDTAANWTSANPVLASGELGLVTDTGAYRIGDGVTAWNSLPAVGLAPELGVLTLTKQSEPSSVDTDKMALYAGSLSGRMLPRVTGPSGLGTFLQPLLARNKVGYWCPPGNATIVPGVLGYTAPTAVGTATSRVVAITNTFTRMRRLGFVSAATAGSLVSLRVAAGQVTTGGDGGGFSKVIRFGVSDTVLVTGARMFVGISSTTSAPTNVEPSTLKNMIGIGCGAADATMQLYATGTNTCTPIDLGANFPLDTTNTEPYELALFAPLNTDSIYYEVTRISTGHKATGVLTSSGGTTLPSNALLLTYLWSWRSNNATAASVGLDVMSDYIETDN